MLAVVGGRGLFPVGAIWGDVRPGVAHFDRAAFNHVVAAEYADAGVKFANDRWVKLALGVQAAAVIVEPVDALQLSDGVKHAKRHADKVWPPVWRNKIIVITNTGWQRLIGLACAEGFPVVAADKTLFEPLVFDQPITD